MSQLSQNTSISEVEKQEIYRSLLEQLKQFCQIEHFRLTLDESESKLPSEIYDNAKISCDSCKTSETYGFKCHYYKCPHFKGCHECGSTFKHFPKCSTAPNCDSCGKKNVEDTRRHLNHCEYVPKCELYGCKNATFVK